MALKPRTKFLVGGALILGVAGYLMATAIAQTGTYYMTPTELATKVAQDPSFYGTGIKVGARVVPGSVIRVPGGRDMTFRVTDGDKTYPVSFHGLAPDTFTDSVDVVMDGRLAQDGTFRATTVLAKCASRYENAPAKYRSTPGYKSAAPATTRT
ncbi:MAG TPA: cytochrome c maturation protein CcmE [Gemmatimonadaceae bacterium]|nr:cytochrome c maturation protein CcmE [Gemmatimonadaceae bacterium]